MKKNILILTPINNKELRKPSDYVGFCDSDFMIKQSILESGPEFIETEYDLMQANKNICEKAKMLIKANPNTDALLIDCFVDPGVQLLRRQLNIPIVGAGEASLRSAQKSCKKFTIITIQQAQNIVKDMTNLHPARQQLASIRTIDYCISKLITNITAATELIYEQSMLAINNDNADCIILGCTGLNKHHSLLKLMLENSGYNIPIINPLPETISYLKTRTLLENP